jgi:hypothetical protein
VSAKLAVTTCSKPLGGFFGVTAGMLRAAAFGVHLVGVGHSR